MSEIGVLDPEIFAPTLVAIGSQLPLSQDYDGLVLKLITMDLHYNQYIL